MHSNVALLPCGPFSLDLLNHDEQTIRLFRGIVAMPNASTITTLPIVNVQNDFQNVIADVQDGLGSEDFWVSCYKTGSTSVHGKVRVSKEGSEVKLSSISGVEFIRGQRVRYRVCL